MTGSEQKSLRGKDRKMNAPPAKAGGIGQQLKLAIADEIRRQLGGLAKVNLRLQF